MCSKFFPEAKGEGGTTPNGIRTFRILLMGPKVGGGAVRNERRGGKTRKKKKDGIKKKPKTNGGARGETRIDSQENIRWERSPKESEP